MKKRTVVLVLALAITALFIVGCQRDSSTAQAPATTAPAAPAAPAPAAPAPVVERGEINVADLADGVYFAMEDEFASSGWKYVVTVVIEDGKIADVDWNGVHVNAGASKKAVDKAGRYNMVRFGGAQSEWYEQAEKTEAYLLETQDPYGITYTDAAGHTDDIAGVSIHVVEMYDLVQEALAAGPVGVGPYTDGAYFAISDTYPNSGWKEYVSLSVLNGRIAAVNWSAVNRQGLDKKTQDKAGNYQMVARGGAIDEWHVQAARAEAHLIDLQDPSVFTYDDGGYTDDVAGVTIHIDALVDLAAEALDAGPVELGSYADGGYFASEDAFSNSGWKGYVSLFVKDGNIVNVFWSAVNQSGEDKKAFDKAGNYQMVARGGAIDEWYVQAERTEAHLLETQDPSTITYNDGGYTDDIAGVTIHVNDFLVLVEKALAAGPRR